MRNAPVGVVVVAAAVVIDGCGGLSTSSAPVPENAPNGATNSPEQVVDALHMTKDPTTRVSARRVWPLGRADWMRFCRHDARSE